MPQAVRPTATRKFDLKAGDYIKVRPIYIGDGEKAWNEKRARYYKVLDVSSPFVFVCMDGWGRKESFQKKQYTKIGEVAKTDAAAFYQHTSKEYLKKQAFEDFELEDGIVAPK